MARNPPGHRMPKPSNRLAKRMTSIRAGNLEEQRDTHRDDVYIDPNRYFRLPNTFGLNRGPYERLERAAPRVLEGVFSIEQDRATRKRTRGIAGPNPDQADTFSGMMMHPVAMPIATEKKAKRKGKRY